MEQKQELYRGAAIMPKTAKETFLSLLYIIILCFAVFAIAPYLPFSWVFEIGVIVVSAILINKTLKKDTFRVTYVLYEDCLVEITRYGLIEKESANFPLDKTVFTDTSATFGGKTRPFYPDEKLKSLLNLKTTS